MPQPFLLHHLTTVERHIRAGERHLLRQREIVDELERHGRGHTASFEMAQSKHLNDRTRLLLALTGRK